MVTKSLIKVITRKPSSITQELSKSNLMKFTFPIVNTRNNLLGAQVFIVQRLFELAVSDCDKALECNPNWIKAYFRKAVALSEQHNKIGADELAI